MESLNANITMPMKHGCQTASSHVLITNNKITNNHAVLITNNKIIDNNEKY